MTVRGCAATPGAVLLPRLERVRELGPDRWLARCPAHDDRTPSSAGEAPSGQAGRAEEQQQGEALRHYSSDRALDSLLGRMAADGLDRPALALLTLRHHSPRLARELALGFAHYTDEVDGLLLALGDVAAREVRDHG